MFRSFKTRRLAAALAVATATGSSLFAVSAPAHATSSIGGSITSSEMLSRAQSWVNNQVPYNQSAWAADPEGTTYREDCSGFVSMAWHLGTSLVVTDGGPSFTNSDGSPNTTYDTGVGSFGNLQPGDAMAYPHQHIWLFNGWTNKANGDFTYYAESNPSSPTHGPTAANINSTTLEGWPTSGYVALRYKNVAAIPADFNVLLWGFNSGQTVSGALNLTSHVTSQGYINSLYYTITGPNGYNQTFNPSAGGAANYPLAFDTTNLTNGTYTVTMTANEIDGQNHTYQGGVFTASNNAVFAKNGIGLYNWTKESDPLDVAQATGGGVQMILDRNGVVWAKNSIGLYGWTQESDPGVKAIAVGSDGTQMILDSTGTVLAKNGISLYNWTKESDAGVKAISTNGGVQMILDSTGTVLAKNSIGLYNWTQESDARVQAIAMGADGTQMILDNNGTVYAKNTIGLYNWTQETDPLDKAIAIGSDGTQMILDNNGTVWAKKGIGLYNWTQESDPRVQAIATNAGVQMILDNNGTAYAKNSIGLYNWTQETDAVVKAITVGDDGTQMILGQ
jgi:hypothetical protein